MSTARITVLYEDQRGPTQEFALHKLIAASVFDALNGERHRFERALDARPMKGSSKLLEFLKTRAHLLCGPGFPVVAILDADKIHRDLGLPGVSEEAVIRAAIKERCDQSDHVHVCLLDRNVESVLTAAGECDPDIPQDQLERAVDRKEHVARDLILRGVARATKRSVRECIRRRVPTLAHACALIVGLLAPHLNDFGGVAPIQQDEGS